jgi:hypothetical protein
MRRLNLNDRPVPGGSMEPRLNPKIVERGLNTRLGPNMPSPLVRETDNAGPVNVGSNAARRRVAGLPERFTRD